MITVPIVWTAGRPARRVRVAACAIAIAASLSPGAAAAQRADNARVSPPAAAPDSVRPAPPSPPLSPRRAFLYSLALPGYSQSVLGRPTASAIFVLSEAIAIAMLRESKADLDEVRRLKNDSTITIGVDPSTSQPIVIRGTFTDGLENVRKGHVEDWVAFLLANHLFAAADAYVAAHLWDLPSQVSLKQLPHGTAVAMRFSW